MNEHDRVNDIELDPMPVMVHKFRMDRKKFYGADVSLSAMRSTVLQYLPLLYVIQIYIYVVTRIFWIGLLRSIREYICDETDYVENLR